MTPLAWGIVIGFVGFHLVYFAVLLVLWWRVILREKPEPPAHTEVERIVRDSGVLTIYSPRRN